MRALVLRRMQPLNLDNADDARRYLDAPEVSREAMAFLISHLRVVERHRHALRHSFIPELHPSFSEVTPSQARLLLPPSNLKI